MCPPINTVDPAISFDPPVSPRVWLVVGDKLGDNAQIEVIAEQLGWPCERKRLTFREQYVIGKPRFRAALYHIDLDRSDPLTLPWPDLVLTVGRRPSMAALWIREQSGERTKLVIVGRPRRMLERFDLVIATGQYRLPQRPNVLPIGLPLMRTDETAIAAAVEVWRSRLEALPRPLTAVLVGGPTKPFIFDGAVARQLIELARRSAGGEGTLFATTSRRTPAAVVAALTAALTPPDQLYRWQAGAKENPYLALLGLADRFIVTGDSISMMVEVARLGKPLAIFSLPVTPGPWQGLRQRAARLFHSQSKTLASRLVGWLGDRLYDLGLVSYARDFSQLHDYLIDRGLAVRLGDTFPATVPKPADELATVVARIKALLPSS
jgi:hypothetical protein